MKDNGMRLEKVGEKGNNEEGLAWRARMSGEEVGGGNGGRRNAEEGRNVFIALCF